MPAPWRAPPPRNGDHNPISSQTAPEPKTRSSKANKGATMVEQGPTCRKCCSVPHGCQVVVVGVLATFAQIFSYVVLGSCRFAINSERERGLGLFQYEQEYGICYSYNAFFFSGEYRYDYTDSAWRAARVFSILVTCISFVAFIVTWTAGCVIYRRRLFIGLAIAYGICSVFSLCTMLFFASSICSEGKCVFGPGAGFAIANGILYACAALSSWKTPGPKLSPEENSNSHVQAVEIPVASPSGGHIETVPASAAAASSIPGTVTTTEVQHPDGTTVTKRVTALPDGSRLVEETVEKPVLAD